MKGGSKKGERWGKTFTGTEGKRLHRREKSAHLLARKAFTSVAYWKSDTHFLGFSSINHKAGERNLFYTVY